MTWGQGPASGRIEQVHKAIDNCQFSLQHYSPVNTERPQQSPAMEMSSPASVSRNHYKYFVCIYLKHIDASAVCSSNLHSLCFK